MRLFNAFHKHAAVAFFGRPGITCLLVLSIASALFCMDVMIGYAKNQYEERIGSITYQCFSMVDLDKNTSVTETDIREYIADKYGYEVNTVLYFYRKKEEDNPFGEALVVGYDSETEFARWWAPIAGRNYFTPEELADGKQVAYISDSVKTSRNVVDTVDIAGNDYRVIGSTMFVDNFRFSLPSTRMNELLPKSRGKGLDMRHYYVIPYRAFLREGFRPDFILVNMNAMETADIRALADVIYKDFEGISGAYPPSDSEKLKNDNDVKYGVFGGILCLGAWLGAVGVYDLWVKGQSKKAWIFMACGLPRKRLMFYGCVETVILVAAGKTISGVTCAILEKPFKQLKVMAEPLSAISMSAVAVTAAASMIIVVGNMIRMTRTQKNYE